MRLLTAALLLLLLVGAAWSASSRIAVVSGIVRGLEIRPSGAAAWQKASVWMPLGTGDALRTAAGQQASVLIADGSQVKLDERTEAVLRGYTIEARRGRIWLLVQGNRQPYRVTTPNAVAGIEGTELEVEVADGSTVVRVVKGAVAVRNRAGLRARLETMRESRIVGDAAPSRPRRLEARLLAWIDGVRQYVDVKARVERNIVGILDGAKQLHQELRGASRSERLRQLHALQQRLNSEIAAFADIEPPPLFLQAHLHRLLALDTVSLALREQELGLVTGPPGDREAAARSLSLLLRAQQENQLAERQYESFGKLYEKAVKGLARP